MAINFPSTPADGQLFNANGQIWTWKSASSAWLSLGNTTLEPITTWSTPTFNANNFYSAVGGGAWTVEAGDVTSYKYTLIGKTLLAIVAIEGSTLTGPPSQLGIKLPGGFTIGSNIKAIGWWMGWCPSFAWGYYNGPGGGTSVTLAVITGAFGAGTNNVSIYLEFFLEVV